MKLHKNDKINIRLRKEVLKLLATDMEFRRSPLLSFAYIAVGYLLGLIMTDCSSDDDVKLPFEHNFTKRLPADKLEAFRFRYDQSVRTEVTISNGLIPGSGLGISIRFLPSGPNKGESTLGQIGIWVEESSVSIAEMSCD